MAEKHGSEVMVCPSVHVESLAVVCLPSRWGQHLKERICSQESDFSPLTVVSIVEEFTNKRSKHCFIKKSFLWNLLINSEAITMTSFFSSPEHEVLMVSYCDQSVRRP